MEEVAKETHNEKYETGKVNETEEHNPCKPKTTLIPKVVLEHPQTQLYRDQMKTAFTHMKIHGVMAHRKNSAQLD
jgi:hypothetical protein